MPVIVECGECGEILSSGKFSRAKGLRANLHNDFLRDLVAENNGKCPNCGHQLQLPPKSVEVLPYEPPFTSLLKNSFNRFLHKTKEKAKSCSICGSKTKHYQGCPLSSEDRDLRVERSKVRKRDFI